MSIKQKFIILTGLPILAFLLLTGLGWFTLNSLDQGAERIIQIQMLPLVNEDVRDLNGLQSSIRQMLEADRDVHQALIAEKQSLVASEADEVKAVIKAHQENIGQARDRMEKASGVFTDESKQVYGAFKTAFADWVEKTNKVVEYSQSASKHRFALRISYGSASDTFNSMRDLIDQLTALQEKRIHDVSQGIRLKTQEVQREVGGMSDVSFWTKILFLGIASVMTLILLITNFFVSRSITNPINRAVAELAEVATTTSTASSEVADSSQALAAGASQQAASLEQTASSLEEIAGMTRQNVEFTDQANSAVVDARQLASQGQTAMNRMGEAIQEIKDSSDMTSKIIKTIDEIAFQTNLLALNAAVEAARAGDSGRGFAVVAEEVRNLAQRSAEAAKNTNQIIDESREKANVGVSAAEEVQTILEQIVEAVVLMEGLVGKVAEASRDQSSSVDQLNQNMTQIDHLTQSNAASAEETAATSQELSSQAVLLTEIIAKLRALVGSQKALENGTAESGPGIERLEEEPYMISG